MAPRSGGAASARVCAPLRPLYAGVDVGPGDSGADGFLLVQPMASRAGTCSSKTYSPQSRPLLVPTTNAEVDG